MDSTPHSMVPIIQFIWPSYWKDNLNEIKKRLTILLLEWFWNKDYRCYLIMNKHWQTCRKTSDLYHWVTIHKLIIFSTFALIFLHQSKLIIWYLILPWDESGWEGVSNWQNILNIKLREEAIRKHSALQLRLNVHVGGQCVINKVSGQTQK